MINLLAIKEMTLKITTTITDVILKEADNFRVHEKTEDKTRIAFEVVEPIISAALGGIMTIFARLQYRREDVLAITGLIYDQYVVIEEKYLEKERAKNISNEPFTIKPQIQKTTSQNDSNTIPAINVKGNKDLN